MNTLQPHQIPVAGSVAGDDLDDYQRIAAAIAFLQAHRVEQPDLAAVAQHLHLSESHVQRLFTRWAGISPKRFLQYLTVEYAKSKIAETTSLLDLSLEAGLSSPGRLHDLFVSLEAMSPGEYKAGSAGLEIVYGIRPTRFGRALVAMTPRGVCNLLFLDGLDAANSLPSRHPRVGRVGRLSLGAVAQVGFAELGSQPNGFRGKTDAARTPVPTPLICPANLHLE